jgi:hypothetical protein
LMAVSLLATGFTQKTSSTLKLGRQLGEPRQRWRSRPRGGELLCLLVSLYHSALAIEMDRTGWESEQWNRPTRTPGRLSAVASL